MRRLFETLFRALLKPVRVESGAWFWIREAVTFMPGSIGIVARVTFYNRYFKQPGSDIVIMAGAYIEHPQNVVMGNNTTLGRNSWLAADSSLTIGNWTGIGPGVIIHTANHRFDDPVTPWIQQGHTMLPVVLGDDVWVAAGVIVLPGTQVGRGAILSAGSVVSGTVEPLSVMAGHPARRIAMRGQAARPAPRPEPA